MKPRNRALIAIVLFIIGGVTLTILLQPTYLPQSGQPVGNDNSEPAIAAVLAKNPNFATYVLSGARYFSCDEGGYASSNGVITLDGYYGFIWDASGNYIITYQIFADASNGEIEQFMTHPFISSGPSSAPQMQYWTVYDFSVGYILSSAVAILAAVIMIFVAIILSIQLIVAYINKKYPSPGTVIDKRNYT
jgi:preprotein translocase subunit SecG